jgi:NAD(P) transhydrogenase
MLFDLVVLGTEPAGLLAAERASELGRRVAVVNDPAHFSSRGQLTPFNRQKPNIRYFNGFAKFASDESLEIADSRETCRIRGERFLFACGDRPKRPVHLPYDGQTILDSDEILRLPQSPQSVLIVGAGSHGTRCARELLSRGAKVSLVDQREFDLRGTSVPTGDVASRIQWGTTILGVERRERGVMVFHRNGSFESFGAVIFAVGRWGCTEHLNLPRSETLLDESRRFWCDDVGQTENPRFFAVGSVVGFPPRDFTPEEEAERLIRRLYPQGISSAHVPLGPNWRRRGAYSRLG